MGTWSRGVVEKRFETKIFLVKPQVSSPCPTKMAGIDLVTLNRDAGLFAVVVGVDEVSEDRVQN